MDVARDRSSMSAATDYAQAIRESRARSLHSERLLVRDLDRLLARVVRDLKRRVRNTPRGLAAARYERALLAHLERELDGFRDQYRALLDRGMERSARLAGTRELQLTLALDLEPAAIAAVRTAFGRTSRVVLERLYARTHRDGLPLSQRLYNLDQGGRRRLAAIVAEHVAQGKSPQVLARALSDELAGRAKDNVRHKAMRIARTEINLAYREGHLAMATDPTGQFLPHVAAIGWRLSAGHPAPDICDIWASQDAHQLGAGNYPADQLPAGHPNCRCYSVTILASQPERRFESVRPEPDRVPPGQRRYYGVPES